MQAGKLRNCGKIQQETITRGSDGAEIASWTDLYTNVRSAIEPQTGREYYTSKQVFAEMTDLLTIRYHSGLTQKMRYILGTRVFDIMEIRDIENRHREMQLVCKEVF